MAIKLYVDTDEQGNIVSSLAGADVIPRREYMHYFETETWEIPQDIHLYRVVDGELNQAEEQAEESEIPE